MTTTAKPLTLPLALVPVLLLIVLLALSVYLFGPDSSYGANQIVLLISAVATGLVGLRTGLHWREVEQGMSNGITMCIGPMLILMSVGMLIGSWILAGTIPALIYYGVQILSPDIFYAASTAICAIIAVSIGSSWTVAGTIGIGLMAIAASFELSLPVTAGAIISGAYFGDKLSPLSDTTNLAAATAGVDLFDHIRHMLWTTVPGFVLALLIFAIIGGGASAEPAQIEELRSNLRQQFNIGPHLLAPLLFMLFLVYKRTPALPAIILSTGLGVCFALALQPLATLKLAGEPGGLSQGMLLAKGAWISLFNGYSASSDSEFLNQLLSKGGMTSMLNTTSLIICAMALGGTLEKTGVLRLLVSAALQRARSNGSLVATTVATCAATNVVTADQFIAITIPGGMYREEYERRGLSPLNLSRTLEDSATLTSALVPWNTCGAYMSATLGISTLAYAPYAFFNYLCPLIAIIYGYAQVAQKPLEKPPGEGLPSE